MKLSGMSAIVLIVLMCAGLIFAGGPQGAASGGNTAIKPPRKNPLRLIS